MKRVLLLQSRPEDAASDNEYEAFCHFGRLHEDQIHRVRLDRGEFPEINLSDYSAIIMGGGPANFAYVESQKSSMQREFEPWLRELLRRIIDEDKPFLGACLGFGAIVSVMGGRMSFEYGEPVGAIEVEKSDTNDVLLDSLPQTFLAFVGHKEGVLELPEGATELARSSTCSQMLRVGQNVYATQFHPELDGPGLALRIQTYRDAGYFPPEEVEELVEMALHTDVVWPVQILEAFAERFVHE